MSTRGPDPSSRYANFSPFASTKWIGSAIAGDTTLILDALEADVCSESIPAEVDGDQVGGLIAVSRTCMLLAGTVPSF